MSRLTSSLFAAAVIGHVIGQLGWIDALFIPLVLLGPIITGAIAAARGVTYSWIAVVWCSAGIAMAWGDWVVNREDVVFHVALALIMPLFAGLGYGILTLATRSRSTA